MKLDKIQLSANITRIITGAVIAIVGLILLLKPGTSLVTVCYILGVASAIKGVVKIIESKKSNNTGAMVSGVATLVLAFVLFLHPEFLLSIFPVIIGIGILGYGIISLLSHKAKGIVPKIIPAVSVIVGIAVIVVPFKFAETITAVTGLALVIIGILLAISDFIFKKYIDTTDIPKIPDDGYKEVEFRDVEEN